MIDQIAREPGEAQIENVGARSFVAWRPMQEDVGRLEIAVDDAARVRVRQAAEHLVDGRPHHAPGKQPFGARPVDPLVERPPRHHVHHQVGRAVGEDAVVSRPHDGGMRQAGERYGLFLEHAVHLEARS